MDKPRRGLAGAGAVRRSSSGASGRSWRWWSHRRPPGQSSWRRCFTRCLTA